MPRPHIGVSSFRVLENGNLFLGHFTNNNHFQTGSYLMETESLIKQVPDDKGVQGIYNAVYTEQNGTTAT